MKKELLNIALVIIILCSGYHISSSQDMLGIMNSNYAGTNSTLINPASMVNSKLCMDINVVTFNPSFQNNYLYINKEDYSLSGIFKKSLFSDSQRTNTSDDDGMLISDNNNKQNKYFYNNISIQLPSVMIAYNRHAFALNTSARSVVSIRNIADHAAKFFYEGTDYKPQQGINYDFHDAEITQMSWSEISLSYAYLFKQNALSQWSAGISLKYLLGFNSVFIRGYDNKYVMIDDATLQVNNLDAEYGYTQPPICPETNAFIAPERLVQGQGFGFNIGIEYQRNKKVNRNTSGKGFNCNKYEDYLYKIGLSLIDIGSIKFNNAQTYKLDNVSTYWEGFDTTEVGSLNDFNKTLSYKFHGDSLASRASDNFSIALPAFVSLQFDYQLKPGFYLNTTVIQNLKVGKYQASRPNLLAVIPRYELAWAEVSVPISIYNYSMASVGVAVRFLGITVGTDKLGSILGFNDVYGMDFYCSIKLSFVNGTCSKKCNNSKLALLDFKNKKKNKRTTRPNSFAHN